MIWRRQTLSIFTFQGDLARSWLIPSTAVYPNLLNIYSIVIIINRFLYLLPSQPGIPFPDRIASRRKPTDISINQKVRLDTMVTDLVRGQEIEVSGRVGNHVSLVWSLGCAGLVTEPVTRYGAIKESVSVQV